MSFNNIYLELVDVEPYSRYQKNVPSAVSGWRLNPKDLSHRVEFLLASPSSKFNYQSDVIELYSEKEDRYFRMANSVLFDMAYLIPYVEDGDEVTGEILVDNVNTLVDEIAGTTRYDEFVEKAKGIENTAVLLQLYKSCLTRELPATIFSYMESRLIDDPSISEEDLKFIKANMVGDKDEVMANSRSSSAVDTVKESISRASKSTKGAKRGSDSNSKTTNSTTKSREGSTK